MKEDYVIKVHAGLKSGELEFACQGCGSCCAGEGYVFLGEDEMPGLAGVLGAGEAASGKYFLKFQGRYRLMGGYDEPCILLDNKKKCSAYEARPRQCSSFPFWIEYMSNAEDFRDITGFCLGVRKLMEEAEKEDA